MSLNSEVVISIYTEAVLGVSGPADESEERKRFRAQVTAEIEEAAKKGLLLEIPDDS